jgi:hypothetical protein
LEKNQTTIDIHCTDSGQPPLSTTVSLVIDIKETIQVPKVIVLKNQKVVIENVKSFTVGELEVVNQLSGDTITGVSQPALRRHNHRGKSTSSQETQSHE